MEPLNAELVIFDMFVLNIDTQVQNATRFLYFGHEYMSFMEFKVVIPEPQNYYVHCCYLKLEQKLF